MRLLLLPLVLVLASPVGAQDQDFDAWPQADPLAPDRDPATEPEPDTRRAPPPPPRETTAVDVPRAKPSPFMPGRVELAYRAWYIGHLNVRALRERGGAISDSQTHDDIGIDDGLGQVLNLRVKLFKWLEVRSEYLHVQSTGRESLGASEAVVYNGQAFTNEDIFSRLTTEVITLEFNLGWEFSWVQIGGLVGARFVSTRLGIRSEDDSDHTSERDSYWSSVLGFEARFRARSEPDVGGYIRVRGNAGYWDNEVTAYFDFESGLTVTFVKYVRVTLGYRFLFGYLHEHGKRDRISEIEYGGPWAGLALRF
jgi:hypothetical protein